MASISNVKLSATKDAASSVWQVTVSYKANFSAFELANFNYKDGFVLWEADASPNSDDKITGVVAVSQFNPSVSPTVRTMTYTLKASEVDRADDGNIGEQLYAVVRLRNLDLNLLVQKKSPVLNINL